jgi:GGDEF domain-containing protein
METNIYQQREILLINAIDQAVILLDTDGRIQHANTLACQTFGLSQESLYKQLLLENFVLDEQMHAICLRSTDNKMCANPVRKVKLPDPNGKSDIALLWHPTTPLSRSIDLSTGLPDRNMLIQQLKPLLSQSHLANPHSLVKIQISELDKDHITQADTEQLESLMTDIAALLAPNIRQRDLLSRSGSDCFALLLRGCDLEHATSIVIKLMSELQSYHEDYPDTHLPPWRVCTGIIPLTVGDSVEQTFEHAKKACQQACNKQDGIAVLSEDNWENLN